MRQFLSHLAVEGKVAASTRNVALCALLFLYRGVLGVGLPYDGDHASPDSVRREVKRAIKKDSRGR